MTTSLTPQQFVAKWRNATLKERSAAQEHFFDYLKFTYTARREYRITLDDLLKPASLDILRNVSRNPDALKAPQTTAGFAKLAELQGCFATVVQWDRGWAI